MSALPAGAKELLLLQKALQAARFDQHIKNNALRGAGEQPATPFDKIDDNALRQSSQELALQDRILFMALCLVQSIEQGSDDGRVSCAHLPLQLPGGSFGGRHHHGFEAAYHC